MIRDFDLEPGLDVGRVPLFWGNRPNLPDRFPDQIFRQTMKSRCIFRLVLLSFAARLPAQSPPFTQPVYQVRVEKNVAYGTATNFAGNPETLRLDLFKPVGDGQTQRPLWVYVHGGAWLEASVKDTPTDSLLCAEMARRGYVVANVEYRRGFHRLKNYTPYALCNNVLGQSLCVYAYDTSELVRAVFRAMQDVKGAVRFLKNRAAQDSTDVENVFLGGTSAGGFNALYAAYLDCPGEKPVACGQLPPVEAAQSSFTACYPPGPVALARPDLGDIEGSLHFGGHDATVAGVANFFGGTFHNLLAGPPAPRKLPVLWAFHQTNDVVVDCGVKPPLQSFFEQAVYPLNLCQPFTTAPSAAGSCAICDYFQAAGLPASAYSCQIVQNGPPFVLADPPGHSIDNIALRAQQVADFFSPFITGQTPRPTGAPCAVSSENLPQSTVDVRVMPNPFQDEFWLDVHLPQAETVRWRVSDLHGRAVAAGSERLVGGPNRMRISGDFAPGLHLVWVEAAGRVWRQKVVCQK